MDGDRLSRLTERQRQCLRLLFDHHKPGEIATRLGISTDRVNQLLKGARERLGVTRSIDAARLLAAAENRLSHSLGDQDVGVVAQRPSSEMEVPPRGETDALPATELNEPHAPFDHGMPSGWTGPAWPVPTPGRPFNELAWYQKLGWAVAIGMSATVLAGAMISLQNAIH